MRRLVIAGVQSGAGKTTITAGIIAAFASRQRVQAFKVGPDYIDPTYHTWASGRPARNLDTWLTPSQAVLELFQRAAGNADIAVVEGVMGLFDGRTGEGEAGSTAQVAKLLRAPVILVIDAAHIARSAAAIVLGFRTLDPEVRLEGVILNRIASDRHYRAVAAPIEAEAGVPVIGHLPRDADLTLPERYLGLIPTVEGPIAAEYLERLRMACERGLDLPRINAIAAAAPPLPEPGAQTRLFPSKLPNATVRIAVARDRAFSFYYEDNLDLLRAWGADLVEFSPLADVALPQGISGVYIGGGFPELFAVELAGNRAMQASLRDAAAASMPIYAECGGLMYLGDALRDREGAVHQMAGLVRARSAMPGGRLSLGYRELRALRDTVLHRTGDELRAHEFHYSTLDAEPEPAEAAYAIDGGGVEGFASDSTLASYMHLHFAGAPLVAPRFVRACREWQQLQGP